MQRTMTSEQLSLSDAIGETEEEYGRRMEQLKERLQNLAREMLIEDAAKNGPGVSFVAVRLAGETRGILTGAEQGRTLSFGSQLMRSAGGVPGEMIRSKHRNSNRRLVRLFKLSQTADAAPAAEPR